MTEPAAQLEVADCAAACVAMTLAYHGRRVPLSDLRAVSGTRREGADAGGILAAARRYGLDARAPTATCGPSPPRTSWSVAS